MNNCDFVDTWLDEWLAGGLPADVARRIDAHVRDCERCQRLATIVRDATVPAPDCGEPQPDAAADGVLAGVLHRTTGRACARAEELLPALVDGELDATSREMMRAHLEHCSSCTQLLAALEESREVLPSLAEIEPPLGFTARVLARTSQAPRGSAVAEWWVRLLSGPRGGVELAYVGALLIVVLVGNPVSAFYDAEQHARRLVGAVPVERLAGQFPVRDAATSLAAGAVGAVLKQVQALGAEISSRLLQAQALVDQAWNGIVRGANWVLTFDWRHAFSSSSHGPQPDNKAPPK